MPPRMDIMLFAAGCGAIVHCYSGYNGLHRDVFKSKYLNVLDFVFGNTGEAVCVGGEGSRGWVSATEGNCRQWETLLRSKH